MHAGPSTSDEFNTAHLPLVPIACWAIDDIRFAFDSSFLDADCSGGAPPHEDVRTELEMLKALVDANPGCPVSLFGHADPVGSDVYNKSLSERRARAVYGLIIFKSEPDLAVNYWQSISNTEQWGADQQQRMQLLVGGDAPGTSSELTGADLIRAYLNELSKPGPTLTKANFLAQGAGADRKGDFQGCSEFNPLIIFSKEKQAQFDQAKANNDQDGIDQRNKENAPNRRVLGLFFRKDSKVDPAKWPCPRAADGISGCVKRFWSDGDKRRGTHLPNHVDRKFTDKNDTFACRFYQRITDKSPCDRLPSPDPAVLEIILDQDNNHVVDAGEPAATFVRTGIWDHAFDPATGNLINQAAELKNFIGRESKGPLARRFYFRVKDANASGRNEVQVKWRTEFGAGGTDDAPASQLISLTPLAADPTVFVSHAVFLVTDKVDKQQSVDSGLAAPLTDVGQRTEGQSNHRLRLMKVDDTHRLDSTVVAEYLPPLGGVKVTTSVPVFQRAPDERLQINVHLVNVRDKDAAAGGVGVLTAARKDTAIHTLRSVYARCGIFVNVDEIVIDPPASAINWQTRFPASPLAIAADPAVETTAFVSGNLIPSGSQADIINVIRGQAGFQANDIYIVYVTKIWSNPLPLQSPTAILTTGPGGISFPDSFTPAGSIGRGFVFVGLQTVNKFADPHEMTHMTTNLRNSAGGHFHLGVNVNTGPGNIDGRNLMQRFFLIANFNSADSKRLWDENFTNTNLTPNTIPAQITAIRASRFVRPL